MTYWPGCDCYVCQKHERTYQTIRWAVLLLLSGGVGFLLWEWWRGR